MAFSPIRCDRCGSRIKPELYNLGHLAACSACGLKTQVQAYPAILSGPTVGQRAETLLSDDQASCFFHAQKKAVAACQRCGRFLCALCATSIGQRQVCLQCYKEELKDQTGTTDTDRHLVRYDNIALLLAVLPIYGLTALAGLFVAIRFWKTRMSVLPQTHIRHVLAILIAVGQIAIFVFAVVGIVHEFNQ